MQPMSQSRRPAAETKPYRNSWIQYPILAESQKILRLHSALAGLSQSKRTLYPTNRSTSPDVFPWQVSSPFGVLGDGSNSGPELFRRPLCVNRKEISQCGQPKCPCGVAEAGIPLGLARQQNVT